MSAFLEPSSLSSPHVAYLKHVGKEYDVKVTLRIMDKTPVLLIRKHRFMSFKPAQQYLQYIAETEFRSFNVEQGETI